MTEPYAQALEAQAQFLYAVGKDLFPRGWVRDVYAWGVDMWDERACFAWVMAPEKLAKALKTTDEGHMPIDGRGAARAVRRHGGDPKIFEYERELVAADFLDRVPQALPEWPPEVFGDDGYPPDTRVTFIPEPGYPWPTTTYYSARKNRWLPSPKRPEWLLPENVVDENRAVNSPGVDLCRFFGAEFGHELDSVLGRYGAARDELFMVSHAMGLVWRFGSWEESAARVKACGGLLFPSLAVGAVPATNFGPFVLLADVGVVVNALQPFRPRGQRPLVHVYDTDAWTGRTGTFLTDAAVSAFEQLHGHADYMYNVDMHVWTLGPDPDAQGVWGPDLATRVERTAQLKRELKQRFKTWRRSLDPAGIHKVVEAVAAEKARYAYLEAKVAGVLPMSEFPVAVAPEGLAGEFRRFLDATGFGGELIEVELPDEVFRLMSASAGISTSSAASIWRTHADAAMKAAAFEFFGTQEPSYEQRQAIETWANLQYGWHILDVVRERFPQVVQL